jgi:hypothetical protein
MRKLLVVVLLPLCGCTAARLTSAPLPAPPDARGPVVLVIEPFFEVSQWKITTKTDYVNGYGTPYGTPYGASYGGGFNSYYGNSLGAGQIPVEHDVVDKPAVSRVSALNSEQQIVIREIQRLRPNWQVLSTAALQSISGPVDVVRVIIGDTQIAYSDRALKNGLCVLGLGIPGFFTLVHETQRIEGGINRYQTDAETVRPHLVRYASQPDFAVDTRGMVPVKQTFGLDVSYEEGIFGPDGMRDQAVVNGFAQRLAVAVIAMVEGIKPQ